MTQKNSQKPSVAILGLGLMGSGMAGRLLAAGFPVAAYNRSREKAAALAARGARAADTPREATAGADFVLAMLADDVASRDVWLGERGALAGANPGATLLECSTLSVSWVKELAAAAGRQGCTLLDCPVTGSKNQAAAGELNFLVGGPAAALTDARPLLDAMGRSVTHLGPTGSGAMVKLINNFLCGVQVASLAEALTLIERSGLDAAPALRVLTDGAPGSPLIRTVADRMARRDFTPNFLLRLMAKDLTYAVEEGADRDLQLKTAAAALSVFSEAIATGLGGQDMAAVFERVRDRQA